MTQFSAAANFRDLGGMPAADGKVIACGRIYRSAAPGSLNPDELSLLHTLGIRLCCDLRSEIERSAQPSRWNSGTTPRVILGEIHADLRALGPIVPGLLAPDAGADRVEELMCSLYAQLPDACAGALTELIDTLLEQDDATPVLIHCSAGKDRTGFVVAVLLCGLGVPEAEIYQDYLASNQPISPEQLGRRQQFLGRLFGFVPSPEAFAALNGVKSRYIRAAFDRVRTQYGTVERYLDARTLMDSVKLSALRELMLSG